MKILLPSIPGAGPVVVVLFLALALWAGEAHAAHLVLSWTDNASNEDGFEVERKGLDGQYRKVAVMGPNTTSYVDWGLMAGVPYCYRVRAVNAAGASAFSNEACAAARTRAQAEPRQFTGAGFGGGPHVRSFAVSADGASLNFMAPDAAFSGGLLLATAALDGAQTLVTGVGPGGGPHVRVFGLRGLSTGISFMAYDPALSGGVQVAAGDVDGDGTLEIITAAGSGGSPHVRVWKIEGTSVRELTGFLAFDPGFAGGVFVAAADVDGDGRAEIITAAGAGGGPQIRVWKIIGSGAVELVGFFADSPDFTGGVFVAAGDLDSDGRAEIVTGAGPGGGPHVRIWRVTDNQVSELTGFLAEMPEFGGGVRVAVGDLNADGIGEVVTLTEPGGGTHVQVFGLAGTGVVPRLSFFAYDPTFTGGVFVTAPAR